MAADKLTGSPAIPPGDLDHDSATKQAELGSEYTDGASRRFRYCLAGATALVPGKLQQSPAEITNHQDLTPAAAAIGDTSVTATLGATAAAANLYAEGFLIVTVTPGQGYIYKIAGHAAVASAGSATLNLADPIEVALTTSSRVDLVLNPWSGVVVCPTTQTSSPAGAAVTAVTAAQYGFIQTRGPAAILANGALTVGDPVVASDAVAGAVEVSADGAPEQLPVVGHAITGVADTEYGAINMLLA